MQRYSTFGNDGRPISSLRRQNDCADINYYLLVVVVRGLAGDPGNLTAGPPWRFSPHSV